MFHFTSDLSEILTLDTVEPHKDHLDTSLELNRQLCVSLQRKQDEISVLKEKNIRLRELVKQAEHYGTILDVLLPQRINECVSRPASAHTPHVYYSNGEPSQWYFTASQSSWLPSVPINTQQMTGSLTDGVKNQRWSTQNDGYAKKSTIIYEHRSRGSDPEHHSRGSDPEHCSRGSDPEPYSRGSDHEPHSRGSDHEPHSRGSDPEHNSRGSDHEPYLRGSDHEPYSRGSDCEHCSRGSGHEHHSRGSGHEHHSRGSDTEHRSKGSDHEYCSNSSGHHPFSESPGHEVHSNSMNSSARESSFLGECVRKTTPDPKRPKLDQYLLQLASEQLSSQPDQTEQVRLQSAEDSQSTKASLYPQPLSTETLQLYGSFHGLKVVMTRCSVTSDLPDCTKDETLCFKTSIREHNTIRTNIFPHGRTFTSHIPDGSYRFLWIPN